MRKLLFLALITLTICFMVSMPVKAADAYNQGTLTKVWESNSSICYKWVVSTGTDSTGSKHSEAIPVSQLNDTDGYMRFIAAASSDVNIIVHYLVTAGASAVELGNTSYAGLDAVSTTAKYDTLGTEAGANVIQFDMAGYVAFEVDGQSGTAASVNVTAYIILLKDDYGENVQFPRWVAASGF